jgi:hypothetical protein
VYVLLALRSANGDWARFWMGARARAVVAAGAAALASPLLD